MFTLMVVYTNEENGIFKVIFFHANMLCLMFILNFLRNVLLCVK